MIDIQEYVTTARQNIRIAIAIRETNAARISEAAGLSKNTLGAWLRGTTTSISYENLLVICGLLNIPIGILHRPGSVTPGRLELQKTLDRLSPEQLQAALAEVENRNSDNGSMQ